MLWAQCRQHSQDPFQHIKLLLMQLKCQIQYTEQLELDSINTGLQIRCIPGKMQSGGARCSPSVKLKQLNSATHCYRTAWKAIGKNLSMGVKLKRHHHKKPQTCRKSLCWLLPSHWDRAMGLERFTLRAPSSSGSLTQGPALPLLQISTAGFSKQD